MSTAKALPLNRECNQKSEINSLFLHALDDFLDQGLEVTFDPIGGFLNFLMSELFTGHAGSHVGDTGDADDR